LGRGEELNPDFFELRISICPGAPGFEFRICPAPFAIALAAGLLGCLVMCIYRAVLAGAFRLVAAGAAAAVDGGVAVELFQEWVSAKRNAAAHHAQRAALADFGAIFPLGVNSGSSDLSQSCRGEFAQGFEKVSGDSVLRNCCGHRDFYRPASSKSFSTACEFFGRFVPGLPTVKLGYSEELPMKCPTEGG
jgi:hypothetical protein